MTAANFEQLAASDGELDVALGAALIARDVYGELDVGKLLARFDELALGLAGADLARASAQARAEALSAHVYGTLGFAGNERDYYDPRNSLLSDVLERKTGIPISLALVYCEIARRVGVRAEGVGFPGHFLVRVFGAAPGDEVLVDPFYGGRVVDDAALATLFERVSGQSSAKEAGGDARASQARMTAEMTAATTGRAFLSRWLMNLRGIHLSRGDLPRAFLVVDRLVSLNPRNRGLLRDRGLLAARLGATAAAREDLARALALDPSGERASELRAVLAKLDEKAAASN